MAAATSTAKLRMATPDPTLPKPWKGLVDCTSGKRSFWNPETNVSTYVRPTADPQPIPLPQPHIYKRSGDVGDFQRDNRNDETRGEVFIDSGDDNIHSGNQSHQGHRDIVRHNDSINISNRRHHSINISNRRHQSRWSPYANRHGDDINISNRNRHSDGINIRNQSHQNIGSGDIGRRDGGIDCGNQNYMNQRTVDICRHGDSINSGNQIHQFQGVVDIGGSNNGKNISDQINRNRGAIFTGHRVDGINISYQWTNNLVNEEELETIDILKSDLSLKDEPKVKRTEIIEMSVNSPISMDLVAKETDMPLPELVPIGGTELILDSRG